MNDILNVAQFQLILRAIFYECEHFVCTYICTPHEFLGSLKPRRRYSVPGTGVGRDVSYHE